MSTFFFFAVWLRVQDVGFIVQNLGSRCLNCLSTGVGMYGAPLKVQSARV